MALFLLSFVSIIIIQTLTNAYNDTNCTYLQTDLDLGNKGNFLVAFVPYVCMSYGKSDSGQFECQSNGQLRYSEFHNFYDEVYLV